MILRGRPSFRDRHAKITPLRRASCYRAPSRYILSDLRYGDGPLYVRYGGFAERYCQDDRGELVTGIEGALHFSNGGGVYSAVDVHTGDQVVIKEARPHAGLAADGADAVARLQRERDILRHLAGIPAVPGVRDYFQRGGHHFLVQDFIEGRPLNSFHAQRHPLLDASPDPQALADHTAWAMRLCAGVEQAVEQIHSRGVVFNDLHLFNVMVRPDDSVALLNFEVAAHVDEGRRPTIGNPGFVAPPDRTGLDIDRYSLACLRLAMFMPLTTLFPLDRGKAAQLGEVIAENFPVGRAFLNDAVSEIMQSPADNGDS